VDVYLGTGRKSGERGSRPLLAFWYIYGFKIVK